MARRAVPAVHSLWHLVNTHGRAGWCWGCRGSQPGGYGPVPRSAVTPPKCWPCACCQTVRVECGAGWSSESALAALIASGRLRELVRATERWCPCRRAHSRRSRPRAPPAPPRPAPPAAGTPGTPSGAGSSRQRRRPHSEWAGAGLSIVASCDGFAAGAHVGAVTSVEADHIRHYLSGRRPQQSVTGCHGRVTSFSSRRVATPQSREMRQRDSPISPRRSRATRAAS